MSEIYPGLFLGVYEEGKGGLARVRLINQDDSIVSGERVYVIPEKDFKSVLRSGLEEENISYQVEAKGLLSLFPQGFSFPDPEGEIHNFYIEGAWLRTDFSGFIIRFKPADEVILKNLEDVDIEELNGSRDDTIDRRVINEEYDDGYPDDGIEYPESEEE